LRVWLRLSVPSEFKVVDANGQSLAYVYSRENENAARIVKVLTMDEARRIASNIAKLPSLLAKQSAADCGMVKVGRALWSSRSTENRTARA
jgi:hypothetical protein